MSRPAIQNSSRGFSLIELLTVVAIIGILTAIAVPSYREYVIRSKLTEAHSTLASLRILMEQYNLDSRGYGTKAGCGVPDQTLQYFTYNCKPGAIDGNGIPQAYQWVASGNASEGLAGFSFTIDQGNTRTSTVPPKSGWTQPTIACWVTRKAGC